MISPKTGDFPSSTAAGQAGGQRHNPADFGDRLQFGRNLLNIELHERYGIRISNHRIEGSEMPNSWNVKERKGHRNETA